MQLIQQLTEIHSNFGTVDSTVVSKITAICIDNGFSADSDVPIWFSRMITMIATRSADSFVFPSDDSNIASLLQELRIHLNWKIDDYGEGIDMHFPAYKIQVHISREAIGPDGNWACSCTIRAA